MLFRIDVPDGLEIERPPKELFGHGWTNYPAPSATAEFGSIWLGAARTAVLEVPSVIAADGLNYVVNPAHPDFTRLTISPPEGFEFDQRIREATT